MYGKLVLEDGTAFVGKLTGRALAAGEAVFNTGMAGYQEVLTDPSYCGQIITMTYPLIGNYGVADEFLQAAKPFARGFIVSELCDNPSNWQCEGTFASLLARHGIPCLYDVDTRAITKSLRAHGTMKSVLADETQSQETIQAALMGWDDHHQVQEVSTKQVYHMPNYGPRVVVMDFGIKRNILRSLHQTGCDLIVVPADTGVRKILAMQPDGIFLSNGPGDPKDAGGAIEVVAELVKHKPVFGICLGHQLLALALGANTYKLKFGHRGVNHPVKNLLTGRIHITSQNHGYAVDEATVGAHGLIVTHRAVNDGTVEGIRHKYLPVFSVQFHPEAAPGPDDNTYLFDEFIGLLSGGVPVAQG